MRKPKLLTKLQKAIKQFVHWLLDSDRTAIRQAVTIVQNIKNALESKEAVYLVDIIPGNLDNIAREKLLQLTRNILYALGLAQGLNVLPSALKSLRQLDKIERNKKYEEISGRLIANLTGMDLEVAKQQSTLWYEANKEIITKAA